MMFNIITFTTFCIMFPMGYLWEAIRFGFCSGRDQWGIDADKFKERKK